MPGKVLCTHVAGDNFLAGRGKGDKGIWGSKELFLEGVMTAYVTMQAHVVKLINYGC